MAIPKCTGCGAIGVFEAVAQEPRGSNYKVIFIQCAMCGGVAGTIDFMNNYGSLQEQTKELKKEFASIERSIGIVNDNLSRIAKRIP